MEPRTDDEALRVARTYVQVATDAIEGVKSICEKRGWNTDDEDAAIASLERALKRHQKEAVSQDQ